MGNLYAPLSAVDTTFAPRVGHVCSTVRQMIAPWRALKNLPQTFLWLTCPSAKRARIHDTWRIAAARGDLSIADLKSVAANAPVIDKTIRDGAPNFSLAELAGIDLVTRFGISGLNTVASWKCLTASQQLPWKWLLFLCVPRPLLALAQLPHHVPFCPPMRAWHGLLRWVYHVFAIAALARAGLWRRLPGLFWLCQSGGNEPINFFQCICFPIATQKFMKIIQPTAPTFSDFTGTARSGHTVHHADDDDSSVHSDALQLSNLILIEGFKNESDLL